MGIKIINPQNGNPLSVQSGIMRDAEGNVVKRINGVWKFADDVNYTENFGFQWNEFQKTQIDKFQKGVNQSKERFFAATLWEKEDLDGKNILEIGSGAGRFSQIVLNYTGANLFSVDYSNATEANFRNNGPHDRLSLYQSSIYELPFAPRQFDKVFCFGVLQHTPDFEQSIRSLANMVRSGGELVVDFYPIRGWYTKLHAKYLLRPITKRMSHKKLLDLINRNVKWLIPLYWFFDKIGVGRLFNRFLPICDIKNTIPENLSKEDLKSWVVLDTFDMFSPCHDYPQKISTVKKWISKTGLQVTFADFISFANNKVAVVKARRL